MIDKSNSDVLQVVVFRAGDLEYGADIRDVREIIRLDSVTSIPGSAAHYDGIINVRGEIIPLINLRSMTNLPAKKADSETRVLIVDGNPSFGLIVDMVGEVKSVSRSMIEHVPAIISQRIDNELFTGICKLPDRMIILMNLRKTMQDRNGKAEETTGDQLSETPQEPAVKVVEPTSAPASSVQEKRESPPAQKLETLPSDSMPVTSSVPDASEDLMPKEFRMTGVISDRPSSPPIEVQVKDKVLSDIHLDALREMGNIGTSHSATSLSQLVNSPINMSVPSIKFVSINNISSIMSESKVVGLLLELKEGDSTSGFLYNLFPENSALRIIDKLLGLDMGTTKDIDEMGQSAIMEVGNIITSSFCDAVAEFLTISMLPSPPNFVLDMADSILENTVIEIGMMADDIIIFKTDLADEEHVFEGYVLFFPNPDTLQRILDIIDHKLGLA